MREYLVQQHSPFAFLLTLVLWVVVSTGGVSSSAETEWIVLPTRGLIAHRGAMATHPENTIAALKEAIRVGVHAVEFDVHWTKDRKLVLMHDSTVNRTTNGTGKVSSFTLAEIRQLDAGSWKGSQFADERIPTLEETLAIMPKNIWLFVDIQHRPHLAAPVAKEILRHQREHQAVLLILSSDGVKAARRIHRKILICNTRTPGYDSRNISMTITGGYHSLRFLNGLASAADVRRLKKAGVRILYCCGTKDPKALKQLFDAGIDFPIVDDVEKMMTAARKLGIEPVKPTVIRSNIRN